MFAARILFRAAYLSLGQCANFHRALAPGESGLTAGRIEAQTVAQACPAQKRVHGLIPGTAQMPTERVARLRYANRLVSADLQTHEYAQTHLRGRPQSFSLQICETVDDVIPILFGQCSPREGADESFFLGFGYSSHQEGLPALFFAS